MIELCLTTDSALVLMGDIFNSTRPDAESIRVFRKGVQELAVNNLPVYAIQGQHDRANPPWPLAVDNTVQYVHKSVFAPIAGGPLFYGLDNYANPTELKEELTKVPETASVLLLHQLMREVFPMEGVWDCDTAWFPTNINKLFIGDFHQQVELSWDGGVGWYSGSTYMCKIDEEYSKSVLKATLNAEGNLDVERVPIVTRPFAEKNISTAEELDAAVLALNEDKLLKKKYKGVQKPVLVVNYLTTVIGVESRMIGAVDGRAHLWLRPKSVRLNDDPTLEKSTEKVLMESCVKKFLQEDSTEYQFMMDALKRPIDEVFAEWKTKLNIITE